MSNTVNPINFTVRLRQYHLPMDKQSTDEIHASIIFMQN